MRARLVGVPVICASALLGALGSPAVAFDGGVDVALRPEVVYHARNRHSLLDPEGRLLRIDEVSGRETSDVRLRLSPADPIELRVRDRWIVSVTDSAIDSRNFLEDAFVVVKVTPQYQLSAGKDRVREGVGYAWNPVDFFRTRTLAAGASQDPKEQRDHRPGHYLLRAEGRWGQRGLAVIWSPAFEGLDTDEVSNTVHQWWGRYSDLVLDTDVNVYLYKGRRWQGGVATARTFGQALELHAEVAVQGGADREVPGSVPIARGAGPVVAVPTWLETTGAAPFVTLLVGGQYTLPGGINLTAEYFHNAAGLTPAELRRLFAQAETAGRQLRSGEARVGGLDLASVYLLRANAVVRPGETSRHYAFVRAAGSRLSGFSLLNLEDRSGLLSMEARWPITPRLEARAIVDLFHGARHSEFGALPVDRIVRIGLQWLF